mmetsp:Transcript_2760/g.4290  ORF Transcript_2760/g.4290 Transcript_2760/m.4290 type:complete len:126 (+) Transcript_2760:622-999(+)|eukprot:CAMPEP_0202439780 /NCGR_PEP_ID=MMETSP1345-20130828/36341_1 /ASSEMBLY_ACC=CAM_ASM_000843 /TAXON_ID=342563 /ORGANISM="Fabrea Fabrea salina" /LENGTH=125 /DNA_ID=CAMNT_0049054327 /DNA_START=589 /DNA_END=966 /DNA_ORIENTATION=-
MSGWDNQSTGWGEPPSMQQIETTNRNRKNYWDEGEVQHIPTMLAENTLEPSSEVAAPPTAYAGKQLGIDSLNQQVTLPSQPEEGIDLSILTSVVRPAELVFEHDENWSYQQLIIEVSKLITSNDL